MLTALSVAAWTEASWAADGALIHAQWHFVWAWALSWGLWCLRGAPAARWLCAVGFVAHFGLYSKPYWDAPAEIEGSTRSVRALWINAWGRPEVTEVPRLLAEEQEVQLLAISQTAGWTSARACHWPTRTWRDPSQSWLRWPIDHLLVRGGVGVQDFRVLPTIGSDHLPLLVDFTRPRGE